MAGARPGRRTAGCVRFDRHAVYLGDPSRCTCPPHLVGRTEAVHLTTGSLQGVVAPDRVVTADGSPVGVVVSAGDDPALARQIAGSVTYADATPDVTAPSGPRRRAHLRRSQQHGRHLSTAATSSAVDRRHPQVAVRHRRSAGLGFDACTAQPLTTMATWYAASPYKAANMYIGGASRGCSQPNLTADWVTQTIAQGWTLIPTYVGLQALLHASYPEPDRPGPGRRRRAAPPPTTRSPSSTRSAWASATRSTSTWRRSATRNAACLSATRTFLDQWTVRLHARGYVSGIYSSSLTLARDPARQRRTVGGAAPARRHLVRPWPWTARPSPATTQRARRSRTSTGPTTSGSTSTAAATRRPGAASR